MKTTQQELPYEKFLTYGPESLTEAELLAIILRTGTREKSALQLSQEVLSLARYPREGLLGLYDLTVEELSAVNGIGEVKAVKLKCLTELSMRFSKATQREGLRFNDSRTVAAYYMEQLRHRRTECVVLVCLDGKGQMIAERMLSNGSVRLSLISPREIFIEAVRSEAVSLILIHNHPSGDPTPSGADCDLTDNLSELADMMAIPLLDHIVIGDNCYFSFRERGLLGILHT